jgi:hypothetical protein
MKEDYTGKWRYKEKVAAKRFCLILHHYFAKLIITLSTKVPF